MFAVLGVLLVLFSLTTCEEHFQVEIKQGKLHGKYLTSRKGRTFSAFTGIPFAKPPIDELRFKEPVPAEPWEGVYDATKSHSACPQSDFILGDNTIFGNEDCLYLNVYTPKTGNATLSEPLPVMFFIHGGGYVFWSAKPELFGPEFLLDKDVVLVTANYRLGPLGFLATGDEVVPGNNGLKDQVLTLKWIKENIAQFGGDPESVTIFGESAGGACVHLHLLSPLSQGLVTRVIAQSGTGVSPWASVPLQTMAKHSKKFAKLYNCTSESSQEMVECLRKVDAHKLITPLPKLEDWNKESLFYFFPVIEEEREGAFLSQDPIDIYKSGKAANIPFISGMTTEEGSLQAPIFFENPKLLQELDESFVKVAPIMLAYQKFVPEGDTQVAEKLKKFYFKDGKITNTSQTGLINLFTDSMFTISSDAAVRLHAKYTKQPTYYYLFGYRSSVSFGNILGKSSYDYGVSHCDDLLHLFKIGNFSHQKLTESDEKVTDIVLTLWTNFARTGNPTPEITTQISKKWEPIKDENLHIYFIKNENHVNMIDDVFAERVKFWDDLPINSRNYHVSKEL